uniref:Pseudouridine synthase I TruA alpha/beta domain-containing protein n=1 Tax=Heliothis virescens TaxID=7102 RepID=A0A2A4K4U0_HELVI
MPPKKKSSELSTKEELSKLDKDDLIARIIQLEAHNLQLKNIISKNFLESSKKDERENKNKLDFSKCHFRRVFLRILYFGWDYNGLAVQEDTNQTIEHHLFHALTKSCLIQKREMSGYHRCGRTDKGVSSFGQVISISLRSKFPPSEQSTQEAIDNELEYCKILNRLLPKDIKVVAWMPIPDDLPEYSARFDCKKRQYKYYFPRSRLDIQAMRSGCTRLLGSNDYRNLCKMDVGNGVVEFRREIISADVLPISSNDVDSPTSMYYLNIEGNAFLWHQIRCIMGLLLLIGEGKETPDVITNLLDVEKYPRKPQYNMALDLPLNLFHCTYDFPNGCNWIYKTQELSEVLTQLQSEWTMHNIKTTMIRDVINVLENQYSELCENETADTDGNKTERDRVIKYTECLLQGVKSRVYTPLLKRVTCSSLEERIEHYRKKRKIGHPDEDVNM